MGRLPVFMAFKRSRLSVSRLKSDCKVSVGAVLIVCPCTKKNGARASATITGSFLIVLIEYGKALSYLVCATPIRRRVGDVRECEAYNRGDAIKISGTRY